MTYRISNQNCFALFVCLTLSISGLMAQNMTFTGTFMTPDGSLSLQLKSVDTELHGLLASTEGMYAVKAKNSDNSISGTVYNGVSTYDFTGQAVAGGLQVLAEGVTYAFYQTSAQHGLDGVDLSPYFVKTAHQTSQNTGTTNENYSGELAELFNYIAGSQLVYYQRTSYLNDSNASSITYVNFCADGRFNLNYDGGFSVEGDYGNAHGASRGQNYGTWQLAERDGGVVGIMNFANGTQSVYAINKQYLIQGRWRIGNTQYAIVRNKAVCQ